MAHYWLFFVQVYVADRMTSELLKAKLLNSDEYQQECCITRAFNNPRVM